MHPVHNNERIVLMDALRGIAILGIFIANLGAGFAFYDATAAKTGPFFHRLDQPFLFWQHVFIEGKFYSIFSFLFGWGFALQLMRSEQKGILPATFMRRRLFFMLLLGGVHLLFIWVGDIVAFYALVGWVLLWIRNWSDRRLLYTALLCLLLPLPLYFLKMKLPVLAAPAYLLFQAGGRIDQLTGVGSFEQFQAMLKNGGYLQLLYSNLSGAFYRYADLLFQDRFFKVLGMFCLGYLLGRNNRYRTVLINRRLLGIVALAGLLIGLPANYLLAGAMESGGYYELKPGGLYRTVWYTLGVAPLALAYMELFFLLAQHRMGKRLIALLQPPGKMAFTNYITHSVVGAVVFYGVGWGMMDEVGPVVYTAFAVLVFALQVILSTVWLQFFRFGPVEWLWRSATYRSWQPFRRQRGS
ncbi:MAG TPA: DUF418 domain-containing protein [Lacibacter sp.]|nr:DUF418 domain-containing protein [Lacibacter sp.]